MKRYLNSVKYVKNWARFWQFYYTCRTKQGEKKTFTLKLRNNFELEVHPALVSAFDEIFLREVYKEGVKNLPLRPVVLDIGANVGYFSMYALAQYPNAEIIAFEPIPINYNLLKKHKETNALQSLTLSENALFGKRESIQINYSKDALYTVGASVVSRKYADATISVEALTIPDIFEKYSLQHCDLLKVDCEGAEYSLLYNCPDKYFAKIHNIAIEVHNWVDGAGNDIQSLTSFLTSKDFVVSSKFNQMLYCSKNKAA
jgi:FkbM family methyltransferase